MAAYTLLPVEDLAEVLGAFPLPLQDSIGLASKKDLNHTVKLLDPLTGHRILAIWLQPLYNGLETVTAKSDPTLGTP